MTVHHPDRLPPPLLPPGGGSHSHPIGATVLSAFMYLLNHPVAFYTGDGLLVVVLLAVLAYNLRPDRDGDDQ